MTTSLADPQQDYGLFTIDRDGGNPQRILDVAGAAELRAAVLLPRELPPALEDVITAPVRALPPPSFSTNPNAAERAQVASDGTFTFRVLNVYANGSSCSPSPEGAIRAIIVDDQCVDGD